MTSSDAPGPEHDDTTPRSPAAIAADLRQTYARVLHGDGAGGWRIEIPQALVEEAAAALATTGENPHRPSRSMTETVLAAAWDEGYAARALLAEDPPDRPAALPSGHSRDDVIEMLRDPERFGYPPLGLFRDALTLIETPADPPDRPPTAGEGEWPCCAREDEHEAGPACEWGGRCPTCNEPRKCVCGRLCGCPSGEPERHRPDVGFDGIPNCATCGQDWPCGQAGHLVKP